MFYLILNKMEDKKYYTKKDYTKKELLIKAKNKRLL